MIRANRFARIALRIARASKIIILNWMSGILRLKLLCHAIYDVDVAASGIAFGAH